jgi:hypothetical protein
LAVQNTSVHESDPSIINDMLNGSKIVNYYNADGGSTSRGILFHRFLDTFNPLHKSQSAPRESDENSSALSKEIEGLKHKIIILEKENGEYELIINERDDEIKDILLNSEKQLKEITFLQNENSKFRQTIGNLRVKCC